MNAKKLSLMAAVMTVALGVGAGGAHLFNEAGVSRTTEKVTASGNQSLVGGSFSLINHYGEAVTDADFLGTYRLVYFGYTTCSVICPMNLSSMTQAVEILGPLGDEVSPVLISVDPGNDTVERLAEYMPLFGDRIVGLTGTHENVARAAQSFRIFYEEVINAEDDLVEFNHTSLTFLMDREGRYLAHFKDQETPERIADTIYRMIRMLEPRRELPEIVLAAEQSS
ncbi:MAG: SCO family protein [Pseudomonadota bacterium]